MPLPALVVKAGQFSGCRPFTHITYPEDVGVNKLSRPVAGGNVLAGVLKGYGQ